MVSSMIGRKAKRIAALIYKQPHPPLYMAGPEPVYESLDEIGRLVTDEYRQSGA